MRGETGAPRARLTALLEAWGGEDQCCPVGLHFEAKRNVLEGAGCCGSRDIARTYTYWQLE